MVTEAHVIDPVLLGWDQAYRVASEGATDFKHLSLKMDFAFLLDLADGDTRVILNRRQDLGIGAQAGLIPRRRDRQLQRLMRAVVIIHLPPSIKGLLQMRRVAPLRLLQHFPIQAPMEAFIFPHGLGMVRPTVTDADAHTNQPDGQDGVGLLAGMAPGTPVISQQAIGQAILPKHRDQGRLHGLAGLRKQRLEAQIKPRMVIEGRSRPDVEQSEWG